MAKLQSHGPGSCLKEHTLEVAAAAGTEWERVAMLAHDIGKASRDWQAYAEAGFPKDYKQPGHSAFGGVFAFHLLQSLGEVPPRCLAAFHALTAHHSQLCAMTTSTQKEHIGRILADTQARAFASEIMGEMSEANRGKSLGVWDKLLEQFQGSELEEIIIPIQEAAGGLAGDERVGVATMARELLGALVRNDRASAEKQKNNLPDMPGHPTRQITPRKRTPQSVRPGDPEINAIRSELQNACRGMSPEAWLYFIEAQTGTGKTEAFLQITDKFPPDYIHVYATPQTSIADQIAADYFPNSDLAQIWNFRRKEKLSQQEESNLVPSLSSDEVYASKYNLTTFNQVALALLHPDREYCQRALELHDCVIILDEVHRLPPATLFALLYTTHPSRCRRNIRWVLGSATPPPLPLGRLTLPGTSREGKVETLPLELVGKMKAHPKLMARRDYVKGSRMGAQEVAEVIEKAAKKRESLLVMVNLLDSGTAKIAELLNIPPEPWKREAKIEGVPVFWLDSTVPQAYRGNLIQRIKDADPSNEPCILLCTPIIQAGVDLDFQAGICDWESIASTLQTAGRVGRHGTHSSPRHLTVFEFVREDGTTTKEIFRKFAKRGLQAPPGTSLKQALGDYEEEIERKEGEFYREWTGTLTEAELLSKMKDIQEGAYRKLSPKLSLEDTLAAPESTNNAGLSMENWADLSTLFASREESGEHILLDRLPEEKMTDQWIFEKTKSHGVGLGKNMLRLISNNMVNFSGGETPVWVPREACHQ
jgi:CRISPR-associated endonuclease Cas3-HD